MVSLCTCSVQHQPPLSISPRGVSLVRFCSFSDSRSLFLIRVFLIHVCVFPVICSRSASYALIQGPFFPLFSCWLYTGSDSWSPRGRFRQVVVVPGTSNFTFLFESICRLHLYEFSVTLASWKELYRIACLFQNMAFEFNLD